MCHHQRLMACLLIKKQEHVSSRQGKKPPCIIAAVNILI
jgi:hypothetical protein